MSDTMCCGQPVGPTGFCDVCGRRKRPRPAPPREPEPAAEPTPPPETSSWRGSDVYALPSIPVGEPSLLPDPAYPEERRFCGSCGKEVGRRIGAQPPMVTGFCPHCRTPFSFVPKLHPGDKVANARYEVIGWLAVGGQGWLYLARDLRLPDLRVVLKGVINPTDAVAMQLTRRERDTLTRLDHSTIVRIITYVEHTDGATGRTDEYIVMEYVAGRTLQEILKANEPLRLEDVTACGHYILAALHYLHTLDDGLLYCDMKPDNVMRTGNRLKVIDLGATRRIGDRHSAKVGHPDYNVGPEEIAEHGLTVRSDVHTVGRTLRRLFDNAKQHEPDRDRVAFAIDSMDRLLNRAVAPFEQRFASAAEMSEQLDGVHRELLSLRERKPYRMESTRFANTHELLDTCLGTVPGLDRWTQAEEPDGTIDDGLPTAPVAAARLPMPRPADTDPVATFLATRSVAAPRQLLREYDEFPATSVELDLAAARAHIELGEPAEARRRVDRASSMLGEWSEHDWRIRWHHGLLALADNDLPGALRAFRDVYADVPGEVAPKLAIGFCLEWQGDLAEAKRHYKVVWRRDDEQASALFGLARIALREHDRAAAVEALDELPRLSRHYDSAQVAAVRVLLARIDGELPLVADINAAADRLPRLYLDGGEDNGETRIRLTTTLFEVARARLARPTPDTGTWRLLGEPVTDGGLRDRQEAALRVLADHADITRSHVLIDAANTVRRRTRT
ncbi:tetratricopeptide repeat protein [Kutzneria sp. NPDC051319]|uniref:serine/threonine-protein kinase n=1 Tax=Kutzneria sp. NPDC051319 TaxID=3155047 RepID=UPI003413F996